MFEVTLLEFLYNDADPTIPARSSRIVSKRVPNVGCRGDSTGSETGYRYSLIYGHDKKPF